MNTELSRAPAVLLRPAQQREELARQGFAQARLEMDTIESNIRRLQQALEVQNERARRALAEGQAAPLNFYRRWIRDLRAALDRQKQRMGAANENFFHSRQELVQAMRERKALSMVIDRQSAGRQSEGRRLAARELEAVHAAGVLWRQQDASGQAEARA